MEGAHRYSQKLTRQHCGPWINLALATLLSLGLAAAASAQTYYLHAYGKYRWSVPVPTDQGYVDAANGDLHIEIPLASIHERGHVPYSAALVYDSSIWEQTGLASGGWLPYNVPGTWGYGGWRLAASDSDYVNYTQTDGGCYDSYGNWQTYSIYSDFVLISPDCREVPFGVSTTYDPADCIGGDVPSASGSDTANLGYHISLFSYTSATIYAADGTTVYPSVEDTNGNSVNTLSTSAPLSTSVSGNTITITVDNSAGTQYTYTLTTQSIPVDTSFGISGLTEYSGNITVITGIQLPDGSTYSFGYDQGTSPGHYGQMTSMTLPTGGQVTYSYSNFTDADDYTNRLVNSLTAAGGTWAFTPQVTGSCANSGPCTEQMTIGKPNDSGGVDDQVDSFHIVGALSYGQGYPNDVEQQYYSGSVSGGTLLKTVNVAYSGNLPTSVQTVLPVPGGTVSSTTDYTYDSNGYGNVVEEDDYGFTGALERKKIYTYLSSPDNNMVDKKETIEVADGAGAQVAKTTITYDNYGSGLTSVTGTIGHDDTNYGTGYTARGNPTEIQRWIFASIGDANTFLTYDTTGQVLSVNDPNGNITNISYADNYYTDNGSNPPSSCSPGGNTNAFPTTITPPISGATHLGYYCNTGQLALTTDQNGQNTYQHYGAWDRPTTTSYPNGGSSQVSYVSGTETQNSIAITASVSLQTEALLDSWDRETGSILASDPDGATEVDKGYDPLGRVRSTSTPYRGSPNGQTTVTYDGLGRPLTETQPDGSVASLSYGNQMAQGSIASPLCGSAGFPRFSVDAAGNKRETWTDEFGNIIEVDEPDGSGNLTQATCYSYDALGDLTSVTSPGGQTRSYSYDGLGRLTSETTPEGGTVTYTYDGDGNLLSRTAPAPNQTNPPTTVTTNYTYDALNRLIAVSYSNTSLMPNDCTASNGTSAHICYYYDQSSYNGLSITNGLGRRTGMEDASGETAWSYDSMGDIVAVRQTIAGVTETTGYTYNLDGSLATVRLGYASGGFRGITESWSYNSDLEPTSILDTSSAGTALSLTYGYGSSGHNNGGVASITNANDNGRNETMTYDPLNRTLTAQTAATSGQDCWGMNFGSNGAADDALGNLLLAAPNNCTGMNLSLSVNGNNQIDSSSGIGYDAPGNMTTDGNYSYTYNDLGLISSSNAGTGYTYDGDGLRVEKSSGSSTKLYWRSYTGQVLAEYDTTTGEFTNEYIYFAGKRIARLAVH